MSNITVPNEEWKEFLDSFTERHRGWLVRLEIHDLETEENVGSEFLPLHSIELDTEDLKNSRINITVGADDKLVKHVLFRPSRLMLHLSPEGADESLNVQSLKTSTSIYFRAAVLPDVVDGVA
jgi:Family of unknown function (DUF5335)